MTHQDIHDQITAFVLDRVDEQEYRSKVSRHIGSCPGCRAAYERELLTKMAVQKRELMALAPDSLRASIYNGLDRIGEGSLNAALRGGGVKKGFLEKFASDYLSIVGIAVSLAVVIAAVFLLRPHDTETVAVVPASGAPNAPAVRASSGPKNFFNQATGNFSALRRRTLGVQIETSDPAGLEAFFREKGVEYPVKIPGSKLPLIGGFVSTHGGATLAHIAFSEGERIIYVFEVPYQKLLRGDAVYVTDDVLRRLDAGERIWEEPSFGTSMTIAKTGDLVVAVVANASRQELEKQVTLP